MIRSVLPECVNILLVEDDMIDVEVLQRKLKKSNIKNPVHCAVCGVEALEMLREENKIQRPYIMLVDINMPRMGGLEFLKEVRNDSSLKQDIAFILTTSSRDSDVEEAYKLNVAGYFLKENTDKLVEMIGSYLQTNEFPQGSRTGY